MSDRSAYTAANRAAWDASAAAHEAGDDWTALLNTVDQPGFSVLDDTLTTHLRSLGLVGARAVQICCNNGRELLSLPSLGIVPVLGIDQSAAFVAQARQLSDKAGLPVRFVAADVYDLPPDLGQFDIALITIGVLNWMPDLEGFFAAVSEMIAPGGRAVIYETHPMLEMFDPESDDPFALRYSYFENEPEEVPEIIVYDGSTDAPSGAVGYWFFHTLGEIVSAAIGAGLVLDQLTEHPHSNREPLYDKYEGCDAQVPMSYTLTATKA